MPLDELAGGLFGGVLRVLAYFFGHIVFELLLQRTGYLFRRIFSRNVGVHASGNALIGVFVWILLALAAYWFYYGI